MAVDRGYGSGKPRSAANSRARRRAAAGQFSKGRKRNVASFIESNNAKLAASPLGQLADTLLGFALPVGKVKAAANAARLAGQGLASPTIALASRIAAKEIGKKAATNIARSRYLAATASRELSPVAKMLPTMFKTEAKAAGSVARGGARSLFPQAQQAAKEARLAKVRLAVAKKANRNR